MLGFVASHVTSKLCGIGPTERSWDGVKQINTGQRSHLSGESTKKRSFIYVSTKMEQARIHRKKMEKIEDAVVKMQCLEMKILLLICTLKGLG